MPLYEYVCNECDHRFEILQSLGAGSDGVVCPDCGEAEVEKQFSTFSGTVAGATPAPAMASSGACCGSGFR